MRNGSSWPAPAGGIRQGWNIAPYQLRHFGFAVAQAYAGHEDHGQGTPRVTQQGPGTVREDDQRGRQPTRQHHAAGKAGDHCPAT